MLIRRSPGDPRQGAVPHSTLEPAMKKNLDPSAITVESFNTTPAAQIVGGGMGGGTACFETCVSDYTSCPDEDTCADKTTP